MQKDIGTLYAEILGTILGDVTKWSVRAFVVYILYWNTLGA